MNPIEKLELLRVVYRDELPKKLSEVKDAFSTCLQENFSFDSIDFLYRNAHNLVGSGATFGFMDISNKAREIENKLKPYKDNNIKPSSKEIENLRLLLNELLTTNQLSDENLSSNISTKVSSNSPSQPFNTKNSSLLVYIIDDDPYIHNELKHQLESFGGYRVESFLDTKSFESAVKKELPKAVIMDVMFPEGDNEGISSIRRIEKDMGRKFVLFFMSARDDFPTRAKAVRIGCEGFLKKPINIAYLVDKLDRFTEKRPSEPIRVLLLDDEIEIAKFHATILENEGIKTHYISSPENVLEAMSEFRPDILVTDLYMQKYTGLEVAQVIRQMDEYISIPIIYLSTEDDSNIQSNAINSGAEDFIVKPVIPEDMVSKIKNKAQRYRSMREKIQQDSLTGLYNHTTIIELLSMAIVDAQRYKHRLSFAMIDIDYFKNVNDTYGHQAGDTVLKTLSRFFFQKVRKTDLIGRYGGEEFCIIFSHTSCSEATNILDDMRVKFSEIKHMNANAEFYTTFSAGVSEYTKNINIVSLIEQTDNAMYTAKKNGRNRVISV